MSLSPWVIALIAGGACASSAQAQAQPLDLFTEIPGVRELSGQVMVRPLQADEWAKKGVGVETANIRVAGARDVIAPFRLRVLPGSDIHVLSVPKGNTDRAFCEQLLSTGLYEFAAPDWIVYPVGNDAETRPDDPILRAQWHLEAIRAPRAWTGWTGDGAIICAFVDTGIDTAHPDLAPLLVPGFNAVSNLSQTAGGLVSDVNGHGTSVAGAAAAMGNNYSGGSGVSWTTRIMPIRATNYASGSAFMSNILYGASWAAFNGAKVVSVSYVGVEHPSVEPTGQVIKNSYGGLLLWAAGNSSANLSTFDHDATTVVGSTNQTDNLAWDTNFGRAIDVMAPGVAIWTTAIGGGFIMRNGTSFASPIAAGVLALAWSAKPSMTPTQAMELLYQSCTPLEPISPTNNTGWGRVDAARAVEAAFGAPIPRNPHFFRAANLTETSGTSLEAVYYASPGATTLPLLGGPAIGRGLISSINFGPGGGSPQFPGCPLSSGFSTGIRGFILIPTTGVYTFTLTSTDGSRLVIDGRVVVDNDGVHARRLRSGTAWLERGFHRVECGYFSTTAQPSLVLEVRGMGMGHGVAPSSLLFRQGRALIGM